MKTNRITTLACAMCVAMVGYAQVEWHANPGGNVIGGFEYLGAAAGSIVPLRIKTVANQPIDFSTADRLRAHINESTSYPIGVAPTDARNGYMLLSGQPDFWNTQKGPFTRLHLVDDVGDMAPIVYAQNIGFRNWMRNGITFTGNSDQAYIGQKYKGSDNTDFVIQWSDNAVKFSTSVNAFHGIHIFNDRTHAVITYKPHQQKAPGASNTEGRNSRSTNTRMNMKQS